MNKYLEKVASFKGFSVNAGGLRDMAEDMGFSRSQHAAELLKMRKKVHSARQKGVEVEMEPGFSNYLRDSMRKFNELKDKDVTKAISHMSSAGKTGRKKFPKAYKTLEAAE